jgi:flagellar assembly factor FliW
MNMKIVSPILGFESLKEMNFSKIDDFFYSLENGGISFTLIDPLKVREYDIEVADSYKSLLDLDDDDKIGVYNIIIIQNPIEKSFVNFAAPIIINESKNLLVQVALDSSKYPQYGVSESISDYL